MSGWAALAAELDAWSAADRVATFWWRDDDAQASSAALTRLLDLAERHDVPVCLAVIPARATADLAAALAGRPGVGVAVHGYAHVNRAAPDARKAEFAEGRPLQAMSDELRAGWSRLGELFREGPLPVLVPPWNRIAEALVPHLPKVGFGGLSTYLARPRRLAAPGLMQVNTHVDLVDWHGGRGFIGAEAALSLTVEHLAARRLGRVDGDEPTGLLTHHVEHDAEAWSFVEDLLDATRRAGAARWLSAEAAFGLAS